MRINVRFSTALWIGIALAVSASPPMAAPVIDPAQAFAGDSATGSIAHVSATSPPPVVKPQSRPDFSGHWVFNAKASDGPQQRVAVAGWEGTTLVAETTMNGGTKLIQRYQIDAETGQLMISSAAKLLGLQEVAFRLVYDRIKPGMDAESR